VLLLPQATLPLAVKQALFPRTQPGAVDPVKPSEIVAACVSTDVDKIKKPKSQLLITDLWFVM
jgi:hypothetical protein